MAANPQELSRDAIFSAVNRDEKVADFLMCLVWSAAHSYRYDSILKPFPSQYVDEDDVKNISALRQDLERVPPLEELHLTPPPQPTLRLLGWLLRERTFRLEHLPRTEWCTILKLVGKQANQHKPPSQVFRVVHSPERTAQFSRLAEEHGVVHAFHGSRMENFFSILNYGLLGHLNKTSAFGEGTYFSSELSVALNFSPVGRGWPQSRRLHSAMNCLTVCSIVDHPGVGCNMPGRELPQGGALGGGNVPEKYYVVRNNDHNLVQYVIVFESKPTLFSQTNWPWARKKLLKFQYLIYFLIFVLFFIVLYTSLKRPLTRLLRMK